MTKKTRRRIYAGLKAKIALETLREQATVGSEPLLEITSAITPKERKKNAHSPAAFASRFNPLLIFTRISARRASFPALMSRVATKTQRGKAPNARDPRRRD
jgi:hypothetical protein